MKSFDANMANNVGTWLGGTTVANQDTLITGTATTDVMSGIVSIQTTLTTMQATLDKIAGADATPVVTPTVDPTPVVEEKKTTTTTTTTAE